MLSQALILVDLQNDFCQGGTLEVDDADSVIDVANEWLQKGYYNIASQDWHPLNHASFAINHPHKAVGDIITWKGISQILWPVHCVQNTAGAQLHKRLQINKINYSCKKGTNPDIDSYSIFLENDRTTETGLKEHLFLKNIKSLIIMGLATDYCVKFSVLDGLKLGFDITLVTAGCRGVNKSKADADKAVQEMLKMGAQII